MSEVVYDISAAHNGQTYADLTAAIGTNGTNLPESVRKGGVSVRFVQSGDNKYVQYRLSADEWSIDTEDWAIAEEGVYIENTEFIYVKTDKNDKILWAIKADGSIYWGAGVPQQVIDYVTEKISELSFDDYEDIVDFINGLEDGDKTLQTLLNEKVDKVTGKGLIDSDFAEGVLYLENSEFSDVKTDAEYKILEATMPDGTKYLPAGAKVLGKVELEGAITSYVDNFEYAEAHTDSKDRLLYGVKKDGKTHIEEFDDYTKSVIRDSTKNLVGKTIVCIGDSVTEFVSKNDNQTYSQHIAEITGANVINIGIGGTSIFERANPVIDQQAGFLNSNYAALDMVNIVRAACGEMYDENTSYLELAQIAAEYIRDNKPTHDDNTAQVERLASIDWSEVYAVTVLGGINDWTTRNKNNWGYSGSYDASTTLGAIDEIVRLFGSTYPDIKIYWLTPTPIWVNYEGQSSPVGNFSDVYTCDHTTLRELSSMIQKEASLNHIPVCDLYNSIGWNTGNFSNFFFDTDGTHPTKGEGMLRIAEKVSEFLVGECSNVLVDDSIECNIVDIPLLDENFVSPVPCLITGTKGSENAKYEFHIPVKDSWIARFKFRVTENLLNQQKDAEIASINGAKVTAKVFPLTQHQETYTYEDVEYTENWPTVDGGIAFNLSELDNSIYDRNLGQQAFSVKYVGSGNSVTIENNGSALLLSVDGIVTTYSFSSYNNMSELFAAISANTDLELQYIALDQRVCSELAKFGPVKLKDTFYTDVSGSYGTMDIEPHVDCAPFFLYYAVSDRWHQVEIFKVGNTIYSCCDGNVVQNTVSQNTGDLVLGGECGVLFKDFVFCNNGTLDTEYINGKVVSSVSPYILIFECHGMYNGAAYTATPAETENGMSSINPDTLEYFYRILDNKEYLPVTMDDIAEFFACGKPLPKRCYVHTFDDWRWDVCLNLDFRRVYRNHGAKPALVIITGSNLPINYNGSTITEAEAVAICKNNSFSIVSHTKDHRDVPRGTKPSQYIEFFTNDIIDGDLKNVDGSVIVYPGGASNVYSHDVMEYLGIRLGIGIVFNNAISNMAKSKFNLSRVNIGRIINSDGTKVPYNNYTSRII